VELARRRFGGTQPDRKAKRIKEETAMSWTTPTLVEICIGLEINGYLPAEI
jgi:coenzyme PQQ precursor peptide PqqA